MKPWTDVVRTMDANGLRRTLKPVATASLPHLERDGLCLLNMASNNYLGLATDVRVIAAAQEALARWGVGTGASRLITGHQTIHDDLERALAAFKNTEASLVFSSGYATNVGVLTALARRDDHLFSDALNHASLIDGCRLSRAQVHRYHHRDVDHLETLLRQAPAEGQRFIVTDGVFSMDGHFAPLPDLVTLAERWGCILVVDDAHGTGVAGPDGRGTVAHFGLDGRVPVQIATLSKALGGQGGFVAGSRALIDLLLHKARSFIYSTGLAPALAAAALEAVHLIQHEPWRRATLHQHLDRLRHGLTRQGYEVLGEKGAPMLAVVVGAPETALDLASHLEDQGILAPAIRPPTVPPGTSRIRLTPMATHTPDEIEHVIATFERRE